MDEHYGEWNEKGATLSDKTAARLHWVYGNERPAAPPGVRPPPFPAGRPERAGGIGAGLAQQISRAAQEFEAAGAAAQQATAEAEKRSRESRKRLAGLHPAHAAYTHAMDLVTALAEQIAGLPEVAPLEELISRAEDEYMPGGPPMSPLTDAYFNCWAWFDARLSPGGETFGSIVLDLSTALGVHPEMARLVRVLTESRMGLHVQSGTRGDLVLLREVFTGEERAAIVPSGHRGSRGELWYARVLPPPVPGGREHVVMTTPYLLVAPPLGEWCAYLERTLPHGPEAERRAAWERHMKYGPTPNYWHEFVLEAYVNYRTEVIYLTGLPDVPESRPHSEAYRSAW
jgi:hypothetical protein